MTTTRSIIDKLLASDAIEIGENKEPSFAIRFLNYISIYSSLNKEGLKYIQGWRRMLAGFHISFYDLNDEELSTLVRLLEYHHEATKSYPVSF